MYPPCLREIRQYSPVSSENVELAIVLDIEYILHEVIVSVVENGIPFNAHKFYFHTIHDNRIADIYKII